MHHDNEKWCKIWRGIDLSFQNWYEKFHEFWLEHLKVSKMSTLKHSFWAKHILFELKMLSKRVIFHDTEEGKKFGEDSFQHWPKEFDKFWPEYPEVSKLLTFTGSAWAKQVQRSYRPWPWRMMQNLKKTDLQFRKWLDKFGKFSPEHLEVSKFGLWWDLFVKRIWP